MSKFPQLHIESIEQCRELYDSIKPINGLRIKKELNVRPIFERHKYRYRVVKLMRNNSVEAYALCDGIYDYPITSGYVTVYDPSFANALQETMYAMSPIVWEAEKCYIDGKVWVREILIINPTRYTTSLSVRKAFWNACLPSNFSMRISSNKYFIYDALNDRRYYLPMTYKSPIWWNFSTNYNTFYISGEDNEKTADAIQRNKLLAEKRGDIYDPKLQFKREYLDGTPESNRGSFELDTDSHYKHEVQRVNIPAKKSYKGSITRFKHMARAIAPMVIPNNTHGSYGNYRKHLKDRVLDSLANIVEHGNGATPRAMFENSMRSLGYFTLPYFTLPNNLHTKTKRYLSDEEQYQFFINIIDDDDHVSRVDLVILFVGTYLLNTNQYCIDFTTQDGRELLDRVINNGINRYCGFLKIDYADA